MTKEKEPIESTKDYIECSQEETSQLMEVYRRITAAKLDLSGLVVDYEKKRELALSRIAEAEEAFLEALNSLRIEYGVPDSGYQASIPDHTGGLVFFVKMGRVH